MRPVFPLYLNSHANPLSTGLNQPGETYPMVLAYHVIFGAYGFWLPNDPRGSWSKFVGRWELVRFGKATTVTTTHSLAHQQHDRTARLAAKQSLLFPAVTFTGRQALAVAEGFAVAIAESGCVVYACAVLPEHVHLVIARHARKVEQNVGHMKARATQELKSQGLWPDEKRPVWGGPGWRVYLDTLPTCSEQSATSSKTRSKRGSLCSAGRWSRPTFCRDRMIINCFKKSSLLVSFRRRGRPGAALALKLNTSAGRKRPGETRRLRVANDPAKHSDADLAIQSPVRP
ncbi:MAG: hypothetical protein ACT4QC_07685 [Planctomycetaceae bacterium]